MFLCRFTRHLLHIAMTESLPKADASAENPAAPSSPGQLLTNTQENYLKLLYEEELANGYGRGCDIGNRLGVGRSAVALQMRSLRTLGLIDYAPYHPIRLTESGRKIAVRILGKNAILQSFFKAVLHLPEDECGKLSCELEHLVSDEALVRIGAITSLAKTNAESVARALAQCDGAEPRDERQKEADS